MESVEFLLSEIRRLDHSFKEDEILNNFYFFRAEEEIVFEEDFHTYGNDSTLEGIVSKESIFRKELEIIYASKSNKYN